MNAPEQKAPQVDGWAIVELFGHARIAGRISEQTIAGDNLLRVDVPEIPERVNQWGQKYAAVPAHTRYFGGKAIYALNPVDELAARVAAATIRHKPVETYSLAAIFEALTEEDRVRLLGEAARNRPTALPAPEEEIPE